MQGIIPGAASQGLNTDLILLALPLLEDHHIYTAVSFSGQIITLKARN